MVPQSSAPFESCLIDGYLLFTSANMTKIPQVHRLIHG
ncbi:Putative uncharacterized protein [Moritella viscosa]|uniref:Uncharacterized protein n=1 Tax=Moritella viscosa TaxID=80854 RepID=A0A1L0BD90_9GAMM|nr:Putative uncharacterized protein [Moritella viscosa]SHO06352.1 Putative uncharacterized protein [Moritella viscosa]SHO06366.1 Putative uncharacterized protein [Moritella viscosa]SHO07233.1 Putative uncharacterized protein [Moritella viscosa]SHO14134.1 Putative uncharacterized protein [Moritella viscosa]